MGALSTTYYRLYNDRMPVKITRKSDVLERLKRQHRALGDLKAAMRAKGMHRDERGRFTISNAMLLAIHEFGAGNVPARRPVREGLRRGAAEINRTWATWMRRMHRGDAEADQVAEEMAKIMLEAVKTSIRQRLPPPLKPATRAKPGRDPLGIPLLDSEQLIDSLEPVVERS